MTSRSPVFLWTPVVFGFAAGATLSGDDVGGSWPYLIAAAAAAVAAACFGLSGRAAAGRGLLLLACACAGVGWAERASDASPAAPLTRSYDAVRVSGRVVEAEPHGARTRVVLDGVRLSGEARDARVRLTTLGEAAALLGRRVAGRATVGPFPGPVAPHAYDFRRGAYFDRLDGAGFTFGRLDILDAKPREATLGDRLLHARLTLAARAQAAHERGGGLAAALTTGMRGGVADADADALRASGLAHLLAISGLHMGLVAGGAFFVTRLALAAIPAVALRLSTKKAAAVTAFVAATAYLALSGAAVSTQRAYAMVVLGLVAVLADRPVLSLRLVAAAAWIVLLLQPAAALAAGFQMSFAAAVALVALFGETRFARAPRDAGVLSRIGYWSLALVLVDVIAGAATGFAAMHHFGRVAAYGLPANLIAGPIMAFWILPMGLIASLAAPVGLDGPFFWAMAEGCAAVLNIAHMISGLDGAVRPVTAGTGMSLGLAMLALFWACLWTGAARWAAVPIAAAGFLHWTHVTPPALVVTEEGGVAARTRDGLLLRAADRFDAQLLARVYGLRSPAPAIARWERSSLCDAQGCVVSLGDRVVALPNGVAGAAEDCRRADLVVLTERYAPRGLKRRCGALLFDRGDLAEHGAIGLYEDSRGAMRVERGRTLDRPWSRTPPPWERDPPQ